MNCIVTAGPTYEPLDQVRRLTNFSSGKLGTLLADFLTKQGHQVTLFRGHYSTHTETIKVENLRVFTTTEDLRHKLQQASKTADAVFHAAAVSDFGFGKVFERLPNGQLSELNSGKISTRGGQLLAELVPTPKILRELRGWFPEAAIIGWKYEVDGTREDVLSKARAQLVENQTTACVANGPAYGFGFGVVGRDRFEHFSDLNDLFVHLERVARAGAR